MVLKHLGLLLRKANPGIPERQTGTSKVEAAHFVDPGRTMLEFLLVAAWFLSVLYRGELLPDWKYEAKAQRQELDTIDQISGVVVVAHVVVLLYYKWTRGRMWFLFQPCNAWLFGLAYMHFSRGALSVWLYNWYLHIQWGSWLGVIAADLRDYTTSAEIVFFFTLHFIIILAPLYHIIRGTFELYPAAIWHCGTLFIFYHYLVCLPLAIYSNFNLLYMMWPPKQLLKVGPLYRVVICSAAYLVIAAIRYGLVGVFEGIAYVVGR